MRGVSKVLANLYYVEGKVLFKDSVIHVDRTKQLLEISYSHLR